MMSPHEVSIQQETPDTMAGVFNYLILAARRAARFWFVQAAYSKRVSGSMFKPRSSTPLYETAQQQTGGYTNGGAGDDI
jgi:hypothetical protein